MELKTIEKELLIKASEKQVSYILTHDGFINNCELTKGERELLNELVKEMEDKDIAVVIGDKVFSLYVTSYNGGHTTAGIKISKVIS